MFANVLMMPFILCFVVDKVAACLLLNAEKVVHEFAASRRITPLKLSPELSSSDRQALHDLCELLGLDHKSEGESLDQRRLVVSKRNGEPFLRVIVDL